MTLNAFKDSVTPFSQSTMNPLLSLQPFVLTMEGTQRDAKTGAGVTENNLSTNNYCARFTLTGSTELGRVVLELDKDANGADLVVQIRSGMDPASGEDGSLLREVLIPAEHIPLTAAYVSIPINLTGLTSGGQYWVLVKKGGDATNKLDWVGESSQDANYPAFSRSGESGNWTANNALHFRVFSGTDGLPVHVIEDGTALTTLDYSGGLPSRISSYIPPSDGPAGGVRDTLTLQYVGGVLVGGV